MRLVLASGNRGKLRELAALLGARSVCSSNRKRNSACGRRRKPAGAFAENALSKARHAALGSGLAALADDSGLEVDALGGRPGVHSARYAGQDANDAANVRKLLEELRTVACRAPHRPFPLRARAGVRGG